MNQEFDQNEAQQSLVPKTQSSMEITDEMVKYAENILHLKQLQTQSKQAANPVQEWYAYLDKEVSNKNKSEDTIKTYIRGLNILQNWGHQHLEPGKYYTPEIIEEWISSLFDDGKKIKSVTLWLTGVRSFFKFARRRGYVPFDPTEGIQAGRNSSSRKHKRDPLSDEEVQRLFSLQTLSLRDRAILAICLYTGSRQIELWRADIEDIRAKRGRMILMVQGKGQWEKNDELVIVSNAAQEAVKAYLANHPMIKLKRGPLFVTERKFKLEGKDKKECVRISRRTLAHIIKKAFKKADITEPTKTAHSMRHSAIDKILEKTGDIRKAQMTARHTSQVTTEIYVHERERLEDPGEAYIKYGVEGE